MDQSPPLLIKKAKLKRMINALLLALALIAGMYALDTQQHTEEPTVETHMATTEKTNDAALQQYQNAGEALNALAVKGRAPKTGYSRDQFGNGWEGTSSCNTRNQILQRDLQNVQLGDGCTVLSGTLNDPYTGQIIQFIRGQDTSDKIQIDHVVALSDAWQKGAQQLVPELRRQLANDPLNLLAVDGAANQNKSDGDAATWLPPNKPFRCAYVARQISVKLKYTLWITAAEKTAMQNILKTCPGAQLVK